jgi:addiction module HigA family antidote
MGKVTINRKRRPTHPGAILREDLLPAAGINQTQLADLIGVSRRTVHEVVQERRSITVDMAQRLSRILGNSPQFWLNMQQAVDLWDTSEAKRKEYEKLKPLKVA